MMLTWTLKDAASYAQTAKAPRPFIAIITAIRRVFTFAQERSNRLARFLKVVTAYKLGMPVNDIVGKYGCCRGTVLRYARMAGLDKRPKGFSQETRTATITLYKQNRPIAEISALLGVSEAYISKLAVEEGINRRKFKKRAADAH